MSHCGGFLQYLDGKTTVTHVIASSLTPKKKVEFARYRIVKPAWVVDSVHAGRLLPWDIYRVVDEGVMQKVLAFDNGQVISQTNSQRPGYRDQTDTSWYTAQLRHASDDLDSIQAPSAAAPTLPRPELRCGPEVRSGMGDFSLGRRDSPSVALGDESLCGRQLFAPRKLLEITTRELEDDGEASEEYGVPMQLAQKVSWSREGTPPGGTFPSDDQLSIPVDGVKKESSPLLVGLPQTQSPTPNARRAVDHLASGSPERLPLTAEEHNAVLLSNPHLAKSSTANPDFLNQYYRESRLHHLSIWKAELKAHLQARAQKKTASELSRHRRPIGARRYIMHVDFDSFFATVSLRKNPQLIDKPVVIAHGSGAGSEIASCNYPARKFGVKNGMWMKTALQLCPDLKTLPYDFKAYEEASRHFYDAILATDGIVQSVSIDEALVDISVQCIEAGATDGKAIQEGSIYREQAKAGEIAENLRLLVKEKTGCDVSIGIGNNILLAKVALRRAKPAGQYVIRPEEVLDFIGELTVKDLPGVAYSIGGKLEEIGVIYVKDIRGLTKERLMSTLGPKTGEKLWDYSRGIDKVEVGDQVMRKSVSAEVNWGIRFLGQQEAEDFVQCLCDELSKRLMEQCVKGKHLTMKIMRKAADAGMDPPKFLGHGKCDTFNKSVVLGVATSDKAIIGREAVSVLRGYSFSPGELRGLGVQMAKLEPTKPANLSSTGGGDSSQRRLQFKKPDTVITLQKVSPAKLPSTGATSPTPPRGGASSTGQTDPIEETPTPEKPTSSPIINGALMTRAERSNGDSDSKLLNIGGTQFILPSQIDPTVLAELPSDVRSRLAPKQKDGVAGMVGERTLTTKKETKSCSASPSSVDAPSTFPSKSQIDPETLNALPEDVRNELLAHYETGAAHTSALSTLQQQRLPQSPHKLKPVISKKLATTPSKKHKITTFLGRGKSKSKANSAATLTQSNFVSFNSVPGNGDTGQVVEEIPESVLAELPEDIRAELLAEQKRNRMRTRSGLHFNAKRRRQKTGDAGAGPRWGQRRLRLPPRPERPTFTSQKLSTIAELRNAMSAWFEEFSGEEEEGPYDEDTAALIVYLEKVVSTELDMEKAVAVVDWVNHLVSDISVERERLLQHWSHVLDRLKDGVQKAVRSRGLPPVAFSDH